MMKFCMPAFCFPLRLCYSIHTTVMSVTIIHTRLLNINTQAASKIQAKKNMLYSCIRNCDTESICYAHSYQYFAGFRICSVGTKQIK